MEQRCHLGMVWATWLLVPLLAVFAGFRVATVSGSTVLGAVLAVVVMAAGVVFQLLYIRWFPHLSRSMGYGSVADSPAAALPAPVTVPEVTLYTAGVCPFCPIIRRRLTELQRQSGFEVKEIDVTFRPDIVRAKGLRSVPVLEANGRLLVGNSTSAQIAEFLREAANVRMVTG